MEHIDLMYISIASILPATILSLGVFSKLSTPLKILALFLYFSCAIEMSAFIMFKLSVNNMIVYHLHTLLEFGCLSLIYFFIFKSKPSLGRLVIVISASFFLFSLANLLLWEKPTDFNSLQRGVEYGFIMLYIILYFSTIIRADRTPRLEFHPYFVLTLGFFVYFSGTIFLFLNVNKFIELGKPNQWILHSILNIFINIIYFIVLWKGSKRITH